MPIGLSNMGKNQCEHCNEEAQTTRRGNIVCWEHWHSSNSLSEKEITKLLDDKQRVHDMRETLKGR